jgi:hypothetical protein
MAIQEANIFVAALELGIFRFPSLVFIVPARKNAQRDRSLDHGRQQQIPREDNQDRTSGSGTHKGGETRRSWVQIPPVPLFSALDFRRPNSSHAEDVDMGRMSYQVPSSSLFGSPFLLSRPSC